MFATTSPVFEASYGTDMYCLTNAEYTAKHSFCHFGRFFRRLGTYYATNVLYYGGCDYFILEGLWGG